MLKFIAKIIIPHSLRERYIVLTILLGLFILSTVFFFYSDIVKNSHQLTRDIEKINQERNQLEIIYSNLFLSHRNVDLFLNDPLQGDYIKPTQQLINNSIEGIKDLIQTMNDDQKKAAQFAKLLEKNLYTLQQNVSTLFEIRLDIKRQFPGMALSANKMTPALKAVDSYYELLKDEIENGEFEPVSKKLYPTLLQSHIDWVSQVSQVRIYLANRLASFSSEILLAQVETYTNKHNEFNLSINKLAELYSNEDSFEGPAFVELIKLNAEKWHQIFIQVKALSELETWRGDIYYKKNRFNPLIDKITGLIKSVDDILIIEQNKIIENQKINAETLTKLLIAIIILFLFFISSIIWSLDWMIFTPIKQVVSALRSTAFDQEAPKIMAANTTEIKPLIDAFLEMDEQVKFRQNALEHQTLHDHLTGLPNRLMLNERLEYQIIQAEREKQKFALFSIDLNHFKDVNDSLGHIAGDTLLTNVAQRLAKQVRKNDTVARLSGDEFSIIFPNTNREQSAILAKKIHDGISQSFKINEKDINIGLSIGIVNYPNDGTDKISLLKHSDIAMYFSKKNKIPFAYYDSNEDIYSSNRLSLINDLRQAIESDQLEMYYQAQVDVKTKKIKGAEALLRWKHPKYGFIRPDKIVELAEYEGIIHQLSSWILKNSIKECGVWHQNKHSLSVSINLSVYDLLNHSLDEQVLRLLERYKVSSHFLTLEITESGMMDNPARSIEMLEKLNRRGIKLSIDDFGTGFSSLAYLKKLPVHELKIDQSFIFNMDKDESDAVIVKSTIDLGHNLGLKVLAEGVESEEVLNIINSFNCDDAQGYLFSKPMSSEDFWVLINKK